MKFWYMESQKPTRDESSWVIGMAKAGCNINNVAFHFDIYKTIAYRIFNRFVQTKLARDRPRTFNSDHIKTSDISYSKAASYNI